MHKQRIAVIGGVAAGPAAAAQAARVDPGAEVVLFEQGHEISYSACEIPYFVAGTVSSADDLVVLTPERFRETRGAAVWVRHRVKALFPPRNRLVVANLETGQVREERFDKFILATGATPRMPGLAGEDAPNVFPVRTLEGAGALRALLDTTPVQHAVVMGGGYIGLEMAEALRARGLRVTILEPGPGLLQGYLDAPLRPLVQQAVQAQGVLVRQEQATGFEQQADGRVRAVITDRGEKIGCQLVILAIGLKPRTELAREAGLKCGETGALVVDDRMRTKAPNVWACGDCIEVERIVDRKKVYAPLSPVAYRTARVAGENAARQGRGAGARFPGVTGASAVKVFGLEIAVAGLRLSEALAAGYDAYAVSITHTSRARAYPGAKPLQVRLVAERSRGRLLGGAVIGEEGAALRCNVLIPLLRRGGDVAELRDLDLLYAPPFAPALDPLLVAANEAVKQRHL